MIEGLTPEMIAAFQAHPDKEAPGECVGLIVAGRGYVPCRNVYPIPTAAAHIAPEEFCQVEASGLILALCHSHPTGSAEPSAMDRFNCCMMGKPFFILGPGGVVRRVEPSEGRGMVVNALLCIGAGYYAHAMNPNAPPEDILTKTMLGLIEAEERIAAETWAAAK